MDNKQKAFVNFGVIAISLVILLINGLIGQEGKKKSDKDLIQRGKYLVEVGGCHDCHSPKKFTDKGSILDETRLLSGHPENLELPEINPDLIGPGKWLLFNEHITAAVGPWGVSFSANLTPDEQTGIGLWQEENFIKAMRTGKQSIWVLEDRYYHLCPGSI
jgi:hypothetical protein